AAILHEVAGGPDVVAVQRGEAAPEPEVEGENLVGLEAGGVVDEGREVVALVGGGRAGDEGPEAVLVHRRQVAVVGHVTRPPAAQGKGPPGGGGGGGPGGRPRSSSDGRGDGEGLRAGRACGRRWCRRRRPGRGAARPRGRRCTVRPRTRGRGG